MCGAPPQQEGMPVGVDVSKEAVIEGTVEQAGSPVPSAYVRLLDKSGDFTAEVQTSATGSFRFFAAPGTWTVRALASQGRGEATVDAALGTVTRATVALDA